MTRDEAKEYIRAHYTEYFSRDNSGKGYICPICGSGSGAKGTGITENPKSREHFTCWVGCFQNADIFEIIGKQYGLDVRREFDAILNKACDAFGITIDSRTRITAKEDFRAVSGIKPEMDANPSDYREFYDMAARNIKNTDYHRGLSIETLEKYHVGYVEKWHVNEKAPYSPRLIVPVWEGGYLARDTRDNLTETQAQYKKLRVGRMRLFNADALRQDKQPVYVVEGEIDALSIIDVGGQAVALCGIANINKLIEAVKEHKTRVPLIIALDGDTKGQEASENLAKRLSQLTFSSYRQEKIPTPYKDANEFLMRDKAGFTEWVKAGETLEPEVAETETDDFERETVSMRLNNFLETLTKNREGQAVSTGFSSLDRFLDGGLYPGLYVVGANSSLGKTTLCQQITDNIAQSGHGILIFSLEMSSNELIAKTLSRMTLLKDMERYGTTQHAKTTRGILGGIYNETESELISQSIQEYYDWGRNIHITEGIGDVGVEHVRCKIEEYIKHKGNPPAVALIDYVQILSRVDRYGTDKQNVDENITELKRISRDYQMPVLGISSFNRENYKNPVSMGSFKESGAIEYSSDVLIGLQYLGWDYQDNEKEQERQQRLRMLSKSISQSAETGNQKIQVKILKNRNGRRGEVLLSFFPRFNFFSEAEGA